MERQAAHNGLPGELAGPNLVDVISSLMSIQGIIMFLQSLPTQDWGDHEMEMLLSQAFVLNSTWANAQSHFLGK